MKGHRLVTKPMTSQKQKIESFAYNIDVWIAIYISKLTSWFTDTTTERGLCVLLLNGTSALSRLLQSVVLDTWDTYKSLSDIRFLKFHFLCSSLSLSLLHTNTHTHTHTRVWTPFIQPDVCRVPGDRQHGALRQGEHGMESVFGDVWHGHLHSSDQQQQGLPIETGTPTLPYTTVQPRRQTYREWRYYLTLSVYIYYPICNTIGHIVDIMYTFIRRRHWHVKCSYKVTVQKIIREKP